MNSPIDTTQLFSRKAIGYLWSKREELDPGQVSIINSIYNNKKKGVVQGSQHIKYDLSRAKPGKLGYGRLYGQKGGFEQLEKECRGTICKDYYDDVDVVNCHPVLLVQYAKRYFNIDLVEVEKYVQNREEYLKKVSASRDEAKTEIIRILYGGVTENPLLKPLRAEVNGFAKKVSQLAEHSELLKYCKTDNQNVYGSFLSFILQTEERHCMLAMKKAFESLKLSVDVLCYDGLMVRKNSKIPITDDMLRQVEQTILDETSYEVDLVIKPFSYFEFEDVKDEDDGLISNEIIIDDAFGAKKFASLMGDKLVLDNGIVYAFDDNTGIWSCDESFIKRLITNAGEKLIFRQMSKTLKIFNFSGNVKSTANLYTKLPDVLPHSNDYFRNRINSSMWKLLFTNGIYDLKTKNFTEGFNPDIIFHYAIPRPFSHVRNEEAISFVNNTLFIEPFKNAKVGEALLHYLSRGIFGDYLMKVVLVCIGKTNSSKGTLCSFMTSAFGSVVGSFTGDSLLTRGDVEATKSLSWVKQIVDKRIAFSNEITVTTDKPRPINGNLLKTIASGGDEITLRLNFKDECKVVNQALPAIFVNDLPAISPIDDAIRNRLLAIPYSYSFVNEPTQPFHKKADNNIKLKLSETKHYDALIHLIIDTMEKWNGEDIMLPKECLELREDVAPNHDIKDILEEHYDITNNRDDYVVSRELIQFLRKRKIDGSDTKLGTYLTDLGLIKGDKRLGRKKEVVRFGIKKIEEEFIE